MGFIKMANFVFKPQINQIMTNFDKLHVGLQRT